MLSLSQTKIFSGSTVSSTVNNSAAFAFLGLTATIIHWEVGSYQTAPRLNYQDKAMIRSLLMGLDGWLQGRPSRVISFSNRIWGATVPTTKTTGQWPSLLPLAEFFYNNSLQSSTSMTLFQAMYGTHSKVFLDHPALPIPAVHFPALRISGVVDFLQEQFIAQTLLKQQLSQAKQSYKREQWDAHQWKGMPIAIGNMVWLLIKFLASSRLSKNLNAKFMGPFRDKSTQ